MAIINCLQLNRGFVKPGAAFQSDRTHLRYRNNRYNFTKNPSVYEPNRDNIRQCYDYCINYFHCDPQPKR